MIFAPATLIGGQDPVELEPFRADQINFTFVEAPPDEYNASHVGVYRLFDGRYAYICLDFNAKSVLCYVSFDFDKIRNFALSDVDRERLCFS